MDIVVSQTGIDVAKDELVVSIDGAKPFTRPNNRQGCLEIAQFVPPGGVVHLEASGGYERLVRRTLAEAEIRVVVHNPLKPRRLAQAQGVRAKTDMVDAKILSGAGSLLPQARVKSLDRQQLTDHSRAIDALKTHVCECKKRMSMPELDKFARQLYAQAIEDLQSRIQVAEKEFERRVLSSESAYLYKLVQTVPGLGKLTARICVCELPEDILLRSGSQIASYSGLAPVDNSSGKRNGQARLGQGNKRLKKAFYMPAICAIRSQTWARELYAKLKSKGRGHQAATVAVMRRLLIRAVAVLKRGTPWQEQPQRT